MRRAGRTICTVLLPVLSAATLAWVSSLAAREAALLLVRPRPIGSCDLMVILRGGALERIAAGVELHGDGACEKVLITGDQRGEEIVQIQAILRDLVPGARVEPGTPSADTLGDALQTYEVARLGGFKSLLVVTSPYHTRRVAWVFSRVLGGTGIEFGVVPSASFYMDYRHWWRSRYGREAVVSEYLKLWLCGWTAHILAVGATMAVTGGVVP